MCFPKCTIALLCRCHSPNFGLYDYFILFHTALRRCDWGSHGAKTPWMTMYTSNNDVRVACALGYYLVAKLTSRNLIKEVPSTASHCGDVCSRRQHQRISKSCTISMISTINLNNMATSWNIYRHIVSSETLGLKSSAAVLHKCALSNLNNYVYTTLQHGRQTRKNIWSINDHRIYRC